MRPAIMIIAAIISLLWAGQAYAKSESLKIRLNKGRIHETILTNPATGIAAEIPDGAELKIQVREGGAWSQWRKLEIDNDAMPWERHSNLLLTGGADAVRLRSSKSAEIILYAISAGKGPVILEEASKRILPSAAVIIPRWQWGADESLRISSRGSREMERIFNSNDPFLADKIRHCSRRAYLYPDEFRETNRKFTDEDGNTLAWPIGYSKRVKLIVIHHTAESTESSRHRSGAERMRTIYEYHTKSRGWGDIGYNFVIDDDGSIYEGRAGGDYVVGAHAYCNNVGSMGISLMGNFQSGRPTDPQLRSLRWLIAYLSDKYSIDPDGRTIFHGKTMPTIVGHRNVGQTACPGNFAQELLPQVRVLAKEKNLARPLFSSAASASSQDDAALVASLDQINIPMGAMREIDVKYMNIGMNSWNNKTWLLGSGDDGLFFTEYKPYSFVAGILKEQEVKPGEIGTFTVNIQGGLSEKSGFISLTPVINNERRLINDSASAYFSVSHGNPKYTYVTSYFPTLHKTGEDLTGTIKILNSGSVPWNKGTITEIAFALKDGSGEASILNQPESVAPGEQGSFRVRLNDVDETGSYSRTLVPKFLDGSKIVGDTITIASRAEPIPDFIGDKEHKSAISLVGQEGYSALSPPAYSKRRKGKLTGSDILIESLAGTDITLKSRGQATIPLRIHAGKYGLRKFQPIANIVRSHPTIMLRDERGSIRMLNSLISPISLRKFQSYDINLILKAPRAPGNYTFSIGDIDFTIKVTPSSRSMPSKGTQRKLTIRMASQKAIEKRRKARRGRRKKLAATMLNKQKATADNPLIRIRINYSKDNTILESTSAVNISDGNNIITLGKGPIHINRENNVCHIWTSNGQMSAPVIEITPNDGSSAITIITSSKIANRFRGTLECRVINGTTTFINELPLETYLAGLAEEPDSEPYEKQRAFAIAARSYALFYLVSGQRKYPDMPYDGSDDPRSFQAYGGAYLEEQNPRWTDAVKDTAGQVLSWERKVIKAPFFSSDNGKTKSAAEVWGWTNAPYLNSKDDPWCKGMQDWGHGVGMSGCGAEGQANEGRTAEEILHYYYPGTRILPIHSLEN